MAHQDFEVSALRPLGRHGLGFVGAKLLSPGLPAPTRSGRGGDGKCPKHFFFRSGWIGQSLSPHNVRPKKVDYTSTFQGMPIKQ